MQMMPRMSCHHRPRRSTSSVSLKPVGKTGASTTAGWTSPIASASVNRGPEPSLFNSIGLASQSEVAGLAPLDELVDVHRESRQRVERDDELCLASTVGVVFRVVVHHPNARDARTAAIGTRDVETQVSLGLPPPEQ